MKLILSFIVCALLFVSGCTTEEDPSILVSVIADGRERSWNYTEPVTVEQFLNEVDMAYDPVLDRINPEPWRQIFDGIRITIVRVSETEYCEQEDIPFETVTRLLEGLEPGEEQRSQAGANGTLEICYRVRIEDGVQRDPLEISRQVLVEPRDEIVFIGPTNQLEPVPITGTLAYINNNNAWVMQGSSTAKRPLTTTSDLEPRVFSLSSDGRQLLIARKTGENTTFGNQLWLINDISSETSEPVPLIPQDVLYAEWIPGRRNTLSYSTGEPRQAPPGWQARNDLWFMRVDPETGDQVTIEEILSQSSGGLYGWWGTQYVWSPNGNRLAWIHADAIGLVDFDNQQLQPPLMSYAVVNPMGDWSWRTTVSWSPTEDHIAATVHGPPFGAEPPENSPVFDIAVSAVDGTFAANLAERAGIWSAPVFSPEVINPDNPFPGGYVAYLQAREWENSRSGEYDLIIADRDGSNARLVFPDAGQPGIKAQDAVSINSVNLAWSPDGRQLAFIYLGNLWIIDAETAIAYQLTQDQGASRPVWKQ